MKTSRKRPHRSQTLTLKVADVDDGVADLVRWLNHFPAIFTRWSCQGDDGKDGNRPYVVFSCDDPLTLAQVLSATSPYAYTKIEFHPLTGGLRYVMQFEDRAALARFGEWLARSV